MKDHSDQNPLAALEPESLTEPKIEPAFLPDSIMLDTKSDMLPMTLILHSIYMKLASAISLVLASLISISSISVLTMILLHSS